MCSGLNNTSCFKALKRCQVYVKQVDTHLNVFIYIFTEHFCHALKSKCLKCVQVYTKTSLLSF